MSRRRFTEREVVGIVARQVCRFDIGEHSFAAILCPVCHDPITAVDLPEIERDHDDAIGFGEGRDTPENCRFVHGHCHKTKTASDKARMAKADRQAGRTGQKARRDRKGGSSIQSRGFQTNRDGAWKKPMNGPAERR